ncbi:MAG: hypothetical protein R8L53_07715 [Mariprofundales bacterium]
MRKLIGIMLFLLVAMSIAMWQMSQDEGFQKKVNSKSVLNTTTVQIVIGGEKTAFLRNPEVQAILKERYGLAVFVKKAGSLEMVSGMPLTNIDALWPSNQIAVEIFRKQGQQPLAVENIFNSPLVIYSYDIVATALEEYGIVQQQQQAYYIVDFIRLLAMMESGSSWQDIGLSQLYGNIAIRSTDPTRSNSGNIFAGLLANMRNGGQVVTNNSLPQVLPWLQQYFSERGYMEHSSGDIFHNFITTGVGANPMIVGYENQLVEFSITQTKYIDYLRQKIRTLYPQPTIWSSHPCIALTPAGKKLLDALKDSDLQTIAWEQHGFRSGLMGVQNNTDILKVTGIPAEITSVMPMPDADVMLQIINALGGEKK